jgi:hypothetical protein
MTNEQRCKGWLFSTFEVEGVCHHMNLNADVLCKKDNLSNAGIVNYSTVVVTACFVMLPFSQCLVPTLL